MKKVRFVLKDLVMSQCHVLPRVTGASPLFRQWICRSLLATLVTSPQAWGTFPEMLCGTPFEFEETSSQHPHLGRLQALYPTLMDAWDHQKNTSSDLMKQVQRITFSPLVKDHIPSYTLFCSFFGQSAAESHPSTLNAVECSWKTENSFLGTAPNHPLAKNVCQTLSPINTPFATLVLAPDFNNTNHVFSLELQVKPASLQPLVHGKKDYLSLIHRGDTMAGLIPPAQHQMYQRHWNCGENRFSFTTSPSYETATLTRSDLLSVTKTLLPPPTPSLSPLPTHSPSQTLSPSLTQTASNSPSLTRLPRPPLGPVAYTVAAVGVRLPNMRDDPSQDKDVEARIWQLERKGSSQINWSDAQSYCQGLGNGWRPPTAWELYTLFKQKNVLNGDYEPQWYWSSTQKGGLICQIQFGLDAAAFTDPTGSAQIRCVQ